MTGLVMVVWTVLLLIGGGLTGYSWGYIDGWVDGSVHGYEQASIVEGDADE